uniref:Uncharacterized protein LOC114334300 n=1 Tax=Diabrotica virgifera virgifera TaxID=50390 RepID=A0A6P7FUL2_DIAVI
MALYKNILTDMSRNQIAITQTFPDKRLNGQYEFEGTILGRKIENKGAWNLALFDYVQTLTVNRKPAGPSAPLENPPIKVKCKLETCKNLELHISNLAGGRSFVGKIVSK